MLHGFLLDDLVVVHILESFDLLEVPFSSVWLQILIHSTIYDILIWFLLHSLHEGLPGGVRVVTELLVVGFEGHELDLALEAQWLSGLLLILAWSLNPVSELLLLLCVMDSGILVHGADRRSAHLSTITFGICPWLLVH